MCLGYKCLTFSNLCVLSEKKVVYRITQVRKCGYNVELLFDYLPAQHNPPGLCNTVRSESRCVLIKSAVIDVHEPLYRAEPV
jgi:hypothetical protein